jgi:hypothetical protein
MNNNYKQYYDYLDKLRDIGSLNMMQSPLILSNEFNISLKDAQIIFIEWTKTFNEGENNEI